MTCLSAKICKHAKDCDIHMCSNTIEKCRAFNRKPNNNEEWLRSATTEQLANVFFEYRYANATPRQKLWMSASEECIKTDIVEWLKQPHTIKE